MLQMSISVKMKKIELKPNIENKECSFKETLYTTQKESNTVV